MSNPEFDTIIELMDQETSAKALAALGVCFDTRARGERDAQRIRTTLAGIFEEMPFDEFRQFAEYRLAAIS